MANINLSVRLDMPDGARFGPGKAALLTAIDKVGSISGASKALAMSYPRALKLVESMNSEFLTPLVETFQGGANRGGAKLTPLGHEIVSLYQATLKAAHNASEPHLSRLATRANPISKKRAEA